jgi:Flp pilus assembly protein TadD
LHYSLGISYERIKKWPIAEKNFLKALELQPNHPSVLNYLAYSWVEQGLHLDRAQEMIRSAVKQRPRDGYIIDSLGWVLYRLGDLKGAVKQLERAVQIRPEDPTINDHLGDIYWAVGRKNEATFQWNRALTLEPERDQIPKIELKLKSGLPENTNNRKGI